MIFSVNHTSKRKQEADEIRCPVNQLGRIFNFIKENPQKRYNIQTAESADYKKLIEQIEFVKAVTANYTVSCSDVATATSLLEANYNAYLRFPIVDWETFQSLVSLKVSDIYIDGPLCFQCGTLNKIKDRPKLRVSPTVSPNAALSKETNANSFFIRPEDLSLYSKYFDVIDFKVKSQEKEDVLFDIYKRGTFDYDLQYLIEHLNIKAPNLFVGKFFATDRLDCGQRCKIPGRNCHLCETQFKVTNTMINYFNKTN